MIAHGLSAPCYAVMLTFSLKSTARGYEKMAGIMMALAKNKAVI
jgi:hypothetical protein